MVFSNDLVAQLKAKLNSANSITLFAHFNPDGDTIGAVVAMYHYLTSLSKRVDVIIPNEYPHFLSFIMNDISFIVATEQQSKAVQIISQADLLICLDFNAAKRVGDDLSSKLREAKQCKIVVDHHQDLEANTFDIAFSVPGASSTCELLYEVLMGLSGTKSISSVIAQALYVGICTDTGSFSYSCNDSHTYNVIAELVNHKIDVEFIHQQVYDTYSEKRLKLLGFCLLERMVVIAQRHSAFIYLSKEDMAKFHYQTGDCEGIVNYTLSMEDIEFGALLTERSDRVRMSFRAKYNIDVNVFAQTYWNGGGHKKASGGTSFEPLESVIKKLKAQIEHIEDFRRD